MADKDVLALFRCTFDDLHGQSLDPRSLITNHSTHIQVEQSPLTLEGIEFTALPSGLHAVSHDVFFFDWKCHLAVCCFRSTQSDAGSNARGRAMTTLGVVVRQALSAGDGHLGTTAGHGFRHQDFLQTASREEWDWGRLGGWFEEHKALGSSADGKGTNCAQALESKLVRQIPMASISSHPLLALETFPPTLLLPLSKVALSPSARILILTRPPLRQAADWTWCVGVLSRALLQNERGDGGRQGLRVLGGVGLGDLDRLESMRKGKEGWVAFTSDAIFKERPQMYDLLLETYPSTAPTYGAPPQSAGQTSAPPPAPTLFFSMPTDVPQRPNKTPVSLSYWDSPLKTQLETGQVSKSWLGALWENCGWCFGLLLGRTDGSVYLPLSADDMSGDQQDVEDEEEGVLDEYQPAWATLNVLRKHYAHLSHHLSSLAPQLEDDSDDDEQPPLAPLLLSSVDLVRLGLSPLGLPCDRVLVEGLSGGRVKVGDSWI